MASFSLHGIKVKGPNIEDGRLELTLQFAWWFLIWVKILCKVIILGVWLGILKPEDAEQLVVRLLGDRKCFGA